jgi:hypothetical protein
VYALCQWVALLPGNNNIESIRKLTRMIFIGLATHDDRRIPGGRIEMLEFIREMPG